ncbi:MAG TPA: alpha/beta hydrolase [Vicinamibacterales bacterium]|jgi:pimeloyl-ACP methyl ester carboxylesterase|nr:alpha/beta hydrolase [Vicinamibacterales bacterium]
MRAFAPPGRLIDVGGFRLHLNCSGQGNPTVILESALGGSSLSWSLVQPPVARFGHVCSYDRAGFGWSDAGPLPRTASRIAEELRTLLDRGSVAPPFVLVGHSFGGLVMCIFARRYRRDVSGLVLVDPAHPEDWINPAPKEQIKIDRGIRLCRYGMSAARLGVARIVGGFASIGALGVARGLVKVVSRGGLSREDEGILAPIWRLPLEARRPLRRFWTLPRFYEALGSQIEFISESAREALEASADGYGDLPLVTLSSTDPGDYRIRQQEELARLSTRGRHIVASNSGHWIPLDQPEVVIGAIRDVLSG